MKRRTFMLGSLMAATLMTVTPAAAQEVTMRLHQLLPPQASVPKMAITPWIETIEKASNGRIKIEHYPAMQLGGKPPSLFDQAKDGVVDIIWTVLGYTPGRFPRTEAFELPFMVTNATATSLAFQEYVEKNAMDEFKDVHPIVFHTHGPGLIHAKGSGVTKLEDMQGLKLRGPTRIVTKMLEKLGATAVGMPVPAVPESLSKGVIDGAVIPWEVTPALKITELTNTHTGFSGDHGLYTATFAMVMNKDTYNNLPDDLKKIIDDNSGMAAAKLFGGAMDKGDVIGLGIAEKSGNTILTLDDAETARWKEVAASVEAEWIEEMKGKGIDAASLVAQAKELVAKYTAQ
ncbi:MAG: C4-dicarboxylate ABC transporter [Hyphomicrobiales bacterium]|nr:MAG: C4-dicarboxylate ABC transporter [Hyphomicrobiales bacterium]